MNAIPTFSAVNSFDRQPQLGAVGYLYVGSKALVF